MPSFRRATQVQPEVQQMPTTQQQLTAVVGLTSGRMIKDKELAPLLGELVESWREVLTLEGSETTSW
jgi:hypothetical protein